MANLTVTARGRITLSSDLLRHLGVGRGDQIAIYKLPNGRVELRATNSPNHISSIFGFFKRDGVPPLSIDEINEVAVAGRKVK